MWSLVMSSSKSTWPLVALVMRSWGCREYGILFGVLLFGEGSGGEREEGCLRCSHGDRIVCRGVSVVCLFSRLAVVLSSHEEEQ